VAYDLLAVAVRTASANVRDTRVQGQCRGCLIRGAAPPRSKTKPEPDAYAAHSASGLALYICDLERLVPFASPPTVSRCLRHNILRIDHVQTLHRSPRWGVRSFRCPLRGRDGPAGAPHYVRTRKGYIPVQVYVRDNDVNAAIRVLKKKMQREGTFREMKLRRSYEKPSERRVREKAEAVRRYRKAMGKRLELPFPPLACGAATALRAAVVDCRGLGCASPKSRRFTAQLTPLLMSISRGCCLGLCQGPPAIAVSSRKLGAVQAQHFHAIKWRTSPRRKKITRPFGAAVLSAAIRLRAALAV
jgi:small subunit ribosomal protein S21